MFEKLSRLLNSFLDMGIPGYDCVVWHKGREVFRQYGGCSSAEEKTPTNGNEQYFIYSCSKPITAAAGMICLERDLFRLTDPVCRYLPEFSEMTVKDGDLLRPAKRLITVKDLFCMTGGFGYDAHSPMLEICRKERPGRASTREMMRYLAREPLLFDPGERWEYSFCHDVLVAVIEEATGTRFGTFVRENIFEPLGMNSTSFTVPRDTSRIAEQYAYDPETGKRARIGKQIMDFADFGPDYESGGAGCISTAMDSIRFLEGLRQGEKILKRESVRQMTTNAITPEQAKTYWMPGYGYGLGVKCSIGTPGCDDYGWGGMAGALMSVDPDRELSFVYLQHVLFAPNNMERYMIYPMIREELGLSKPVDQAGGKENYFV